MISVNKDDIKINPTKKYAKNNKKKEYLLLLQKKVISLKVDLNKLSKELSKKSVIHNRRGAEDTRGKERKREIYEASQNRYRKR